MGTYDHLNFFLLYFSQAELQTLDVNLLVRAYICLTPLLYFQRSPLNQERNQSQIAMIKRQIFVQEGEYFFCSHLYKQIEITTAVCTRQPPSHRKQIPYLLTNLGERKGKSQKLL